MYENNLFIVIIFGFIFSIFTSYFNVVLSRGIKLSLKGRSYCDKCKKTLKWYHLVPIVSSFFLIIFNKGKSFCCNKNISYKYFFTEIFGFVIGSLTAYFYLNFRVSAESNIYFLIILCFLILPFLYIALDDIWNYEINIYVVLFQIFIVIFLFIINPTLFQNLLETNISLNENAIAGLICAFIICIIIIMSRGKGMGSGDIYVVFLMGLILGLKNSFIALILTVFSAAFIGIILAIVKKQFKNLPVPLVPFLLFGFLITLIYSKEILLLFWDLGYHFIV